jgi:hypothetical protein
MEVPDLLVEEYKTLRNELQNIKECQISYVKTSITATGGLIGLIAGISRVSNSTDIPRLAYLSPLIILIPAWCIFHNKTATLTRIVGYQRVLEEIILSKGEKDNRYKYIGWETALGLFRKKTKSEDQPGTSWKNIINRVVEECYNSPKRVIALLTLDIYKSYFVLNYWIFLGLSLLCVVAPIMYSFQETKPLSNIELLSLFISILFVFYTAGYNLRQLYELEWGKYSYDSNEIIWRKILSTEPSSEPNRPPEEDCQFKDWRS